MKVIDNHYYVLHAVRILGALTGRQQVCFTNYQGFRTVVPEDKIDGSVLVEKKIINRSRNISKEGFCFLTKQSHFAQHHRNNKGIDGRRKCKNVRFRNGNYTKDRDVAESA